MKPNELLKFISENGEEELKDFYDKSYGKLQELNKRVDKTSLSLIVVVLIYFLIIKSSVTDFNLGPFNINDIGVISQLLPVLFAYLLFDLMICSIHKSEVSVVIKVLFSKLYKQEIDSSSFDKKRSNTITRILLPFSFTNDLSRMLSGKNHIAISCTGFVLLLPLLALYILPFYFEYLMVRSIYDNFFNETIARISFFLTIYMNLMMLFYFINVSIQNYNDLKN
jgi:hypothetical protein